MEEGKRRQVTVCYVKPTGSGQIHRKEKKKNSGFELQPDVVKKHFNWNLEHWILPNDNLLIKCKMSYSINYRDNFVIFKMLKNTN